LLRWGSLILVGLRRLRSSFISVHRLRIVDGYRELTPWWLDWRYIIMYLVVFISHLLDTIEILSLIDSCWKSISSLFFIHFKILLHIIFHWS
jgi:hypothetical protein